jgi:hypothetical protein
LLSFAPSSPEHARSKRWWLRSRTLLTAANVASFSGQREVRSANLSDPNLFRERLAAFSQELITREERAARYQNIDAVDVSSHIAFIEHQE